VLSGEMIVRMNDGDEIHLKAGDAASIPPGHDAWIVGDGQCVFVDFPNTANYAKSQTA
jgi:quercetin dioxygenase-like cupin family protein